jgi:hypothetical protein
VLLWMSWRSRWTRSTRPYCLALASGLLELPVSDIRIPTLLCTQYAILPCLSLAFHDLQYSLEIH